MRPNCMLGKKSCLTGTPACLDETGMVAKSMMTMIVMVIIKGIASRMSRRLPFRAR